MKKRLITQELPNKKPLYTAPFYGIKGSIKDITEEENYLIVTRYGINGENGEKLTTPKKYKKKLMNNYINDIKKYLEINDTKYLVSKNNMLKQNVSKKAITKKVILTVATASITMLGFIFTTGTMFYTSLTAFFLSFIASCFELNNLKKYTEDEKRKEFIHEYDRYQQEINEYNMSKDEIKNKNKTSYKGIQKEENNNKIIDIQKTKILNKKSA